MGLAKNVLLLPRLLPTSLTVSQSNKNASKQMTKIQTTHTIEHSLTTLTGSASSAYFQEQDWKINEVTARINALMG